MGLRGVGVDDDESADLQVAWIAGREVLADGAEDRSFKEVGQPARASTDCVQEFPPTLEREAPVMTARDEILRDIRTALGRAGCASPVPLGAPLLRNPQM